MGGDRQIWQGGRDLAAAMQLAQGPVGLVSTGASGLWEVGSLLAAEGVGVSGAALAPAAAGAGSLPQALEALQADPDTEIVVLVSDVRTAAGEGELWHRVRASQKPAVICFLGSDPRLAWRAGAIPATCLDEAAMRAAAWVRGWDQALISSRLEERDDQLAFRAAEIRARIPAGRHQLCGLLGGQLLWREAQVLGSDLAGLADGWLESIPEQAARLDRVRALFRRPHVALIVLHLLWEPDVEPDPADALLARLPAPGDKVDRPLIIARLVGRVVDLDQLAVLEARLRQAGIVVAASNAEAVQLAALTLQN